MNPCCDLYLENRKSIFLHTPAHDDVSQYKVWYKNVSLEATIWTSIDILTLIMKTTCTQVIYRVIVTISLQTWDLQPSQLRHTACCSAYWSVSDPNHGAGAKNKKHAHQIITVLKHVVGFVFNFCWQSSQPVPMATWGRWCNRLSVLAVDGNWFGWDWFVCVCRGARKGLFYC